MKYSTKNIFQDDKEKTKEKKIDSCCDELKCQERV